MKEASIIVYDETPMTPKYAAQTIDRHLRDLMGKPDVPMGDKVVGEFR